MRQTFLALSVAFVLAVVGTIAYGELIRDVPGTMITGVAIFTVALTGALFLLARSGRTAVQQAWLSELLAQHGIAGNHGGAGYAPVLLQWLPGPTSRGKQMIGALIAGAGGAVFLGHEQLRIGIALDGARGEWGRCFGLQGFVTPLVRGPRFVLPDGLRCSFGMWVSPTDEARAQLLAWVARWKPPA